MHRGSIGESVVLAAGDRMLSQVAQAIDSIQRNRNGQPAIKRPRPRTQLASAQRNAPAFTKGKLDLTFGELLKEVEATVDTADSPLSSFQFGIWRLMSDHTHTGIRQVRARHSAGTVAGRYPSTTIVAALRVCEPWSLLGAGELASYAQSESLIAEIQAKANAYGHHWL